MKYRISWIMSQRSWNALLGGHFSDNFSSRRIKILQIPRKTLKQLAICKLDINI